MLAAAPRSTHLEPIEISFDPAIPRLFVTLRDGLTGPGFAAAMVDLYRAQPELAYVDKLYDLTDYLGVVSHADLLLIVEAYREINPDPQHPCRTAFITHDPFFGLWADAMGHLFVGREHRAFTHAGQAEAFLNEPLSARPPYLPG